MQQLPALCSTVDSYRHSWGRWQPQQWGWVGVGRGVWGVSQWAGSWARTHLDVLQGQTLGDRSATLSLRLCSWVPGIEERGAGGRLPCRRLLSPASNMKAALVHCQQDSRPAPLPRLCTLPFLPPFSTGA